MFGLVPRHIAWKSLRSECRDRLREYQHETADNEVIREAAQSMQSLDPRVSELFWHVEKRVPKRPICSALFPGTSPGRVFVQNAEIDVRLSKRFPVVHEFVRRGGRIVAEEIALSGTKTVTSGLSNSFALGTVVVPDPSR
jgi:hypothetical protein